MSTANHRRMACIWQQDADNMAEWVRELIEVPEEYFRDGGAFILQLQDELAVLYATARKLAGVEE